MKAYPATLIGRLGVASKFSGKGIGSQVLNLIKSICIIEDANKRRFVLVDAYNNPQALGCILKTSFNIFFLPKNRKKNIIVEKKMRAL